MNTFGADCPRAPQPASTSSCVSLPTIHAAPVSAMTDA